MKNKMRIMLVLVVVLSFLSSSMYAQDAQAPKKEKKRGLRFGYISSVISKAEVDWLEDFDDGFESFYVGFFNDAKIIPLLYFYSALDYYQTGQKLNDNNKLVLHYLSIPLGLKLKLGPAQAFGGVHGALKLSSKLTLAGESSSAKDINTFDAGFFVGAGVKIFFIGAEAKYCWGLVDLEKGYKNNGTAKLVCRVL